MTVQTSPSILSPEQREHLDRLTPSLDRDQAIWASGYLAGVAQRSAATAPAGDGAAVRDARAGAVPARQLTVLFASETGNGLGLAKELVEGVEARGRQVRLVDAAEYRARSLKDEQDLLVIASTHGEGDPPQTAMDLFEFVESRRAPKLPDLRFAVLGLGDSTYEHFCSAARRIDERLAELGGQRLADRVDCDVDYEDRAATWTATVVDLLEPAEAVSVGDAPSLGAGTGAAPAPAVFSKRHPFESAVLDNVRLTGRGSTKETRHLELSLEGSGLTYQPGDALGVVPQNDPVLVAALLDRLGLDGSASVTSKQGATSLAQALTRSYEITAATPRFLDLWAEITGAAELESLRAADRVKERTAYLRDHHVLDIVDRHPASSVDPDRLLSGLRPLQPRLYSLASSLAAAPDEAHLTVSTVRYALHGRARTGVASGYLAGRTDDDATVPVYVQANDHFHLPDDDTPILMIGAGTGVAPYRAFMQEREARGAAGRSWLFFGERNFRSDFLYQVEWQHLLDRGVLERLDLAFSRDATPKTYVQDRLRRQGRDVYAWLEDGASVYVCGDAAQMAPDVHVALTDIVAEHGGLDRDGADDYLAALKRDRRYRLDVY